VNKKGLDWDELLHRLAPLLPARSFDQLRTVSSPATLSTEERRACADSLQQIISDLDSLLHKLTTFLPRYLLDLAPQPGQPHGELLTGSFIFADVTGFTALTGELSKQGAAGREEMNRLMCSLFAALLDPLLASGGDLLIFAGDAVLACFPAQSEGQDAQRAVRTALRLIQAIAPFANLETPYGTFSLTMSAGVERGQAFAAVVGSQRRMELLVSGGPVQGATWAEGEAEPNQVFAGPGIRPFLSPDEFILHEGTVAGLRTGELDDYEAAPPARRRRRAGAIFSRRIPDLLEHLDWALSQVEQLIPFIPPDLFRQIAREEDIRQHPPVAVQFINLMGIEDIALGPLGPELATDVFQRYFVQAQEIVADREGIISQVDPYAKGFTLLNPFGAPTHHEGIPRLAASAALELAHVLEQVNREFDLSPPLVQRTGLTYDRIFTGEIGYRHRREYVVAGPAVNLSARLMSKAQPGQIVLDPTAWEAVQGDFHAASLPPIPLKGIAAPVPRFALERVRRRKKLHAVNYPLLGRREELALLEEQMEEAAAGQGGALALTGEAGIGKSHLAITLADSARRKGMAVLSSRCRPFAQSTPYLPWKDMISLWLEPDETPQADHRQQMQEQLARFNLASSWPAFANLLDLPADHTAFSTTQTQKRESSSQSDISQSSLWAKVQTSKAAGSKRSIFDAARRQAGQRTKHKKTRQPSIFESLRERASIPQAIHMALKRQAFQKPTLVIIEDLQWMDSKSREILESVVNSVPDWPLFLLVTARFETKWQAQRRRLSSISDAEADRLAAFALRATQIEPGLANWLHARAGGKPLFILSYCRALREVNAVAVDPASDEARWNGPPPPLPLSLQELLLAQVDRLDPQTQEMIHRSSVIGDVFPKWLLTHLCQDILSDDQLTKALNQAVRRFIITLLPSQQAYSFNNQSLHEAVYSTLSHAQRRDWHEQVGGFLEQAAAPSLYEQVEQIAYHYSHSGNSYKAAYFTRLAGDKARARQANEAALVFYAQTLEVPDGKEGPVAAERRLAQRGVGDARAARGESEAAATAYRAALQMTPPEDAETKHRLKARLAMLAPLEGAVEPAALEEAQQALSAADPVRPWLAAALVWLHSGKDETRAAALCRELLPSTEEPLETLLREALESLEAGESLPSYADFFSLFARTCLTKGPPLRAHRHAKS